VFVTMNVVVASTDRARSTLKSRAVFLNEFMGLFGCPRPGWNLYDSHLGYRNSRIKVSGEKSASRKAKQKRGEVSTIADRVNRQKKLKRSKWSCLRKRPLLLSAYAK
jgi:hypothetical protein